MAYLIKVTLAWTVFLLLFEILYKDNGKFTANRIYLLLNIFVALLLPFIQLPSNAPVAIHATQNFYTTSATMIQQSAVFASAPKLVTSTAWPSLSLIIGIIYSLGVLGLFIKILMELSKIIRLVRQIPAQIIYGHKLITTGKSHSPYSFMGYIFLSDPSAYNTHELKYIIRHETAHNARKHWLDLWLTQLVCIAFWFHPLIWRYRYLLQLQHEYEADDIAATSDRYTYGHFLLGQTLLNGIPSIAHSFHFSSIKNRINMLTKKHSIRSGSWKYILLVPALFGCSFLMAKTAANTGHTLLSNELAFNGNVFTWRDSIFYEQKEKQKRQIIFSMNGEPVYQNKKLQIQATYGHAERAWDYRDYIAKEFSALCKNTPDSLAGINLRSLVINDQGKVVYYEVQYFRPRAKYGDDPKILYMFPKPEPVLDGLIEKVINEGPRWKPAMKDGKPVNSLVTLTGGC